MLGVGLLAGIGFTVSLFIAELAFGHGKGPIDAAKLSIFAASVAAGVLGFLFLRFVRPPETVAEEEEAETH